MGDETIAVEVVYAVPGDHSLIALQVPRGTTAGEAVRCSGILDERPGADITHIGVFGEHVGHDHPLEDGDRVEIYRPLEADPKEVRRDAARRGRTMKNRD